MKSRYRVIQAKEPAAQRHQIKGSSIMDRGAIMVEVRGIEPLSEDLWRNGSTCVSDSLDFAIAHAHRPA
jgi:hypothetical protein